MDKYLSIYPKFTAIDVNDDFTTFTITTESEELDFVNAETGELISSSDSKDLAENAETTEE